MIQARKLAASVLSYAHDEIIEFGVKIGTDAERLHVAGMFTNGSRSVVFSIPTLKSLENISQISLMDSYVWVRHADGGYLLNGESLSQSGIVVSLDKASQNIISISAVKDSGWSFSNNSVVLVSGYFKFKLV